MLSRIRGAFCRLRAVLVVASLAALTAAAPAHEGHDHGPPPAAAGTASPRVAVHSDTYELVGILRGDRLAIFLDRFDTDEPVTDAGLAVTLGEEDVQASREPDGTYGLASPKLRGEGPLELVFAVTGGAGDDLLIGTLNRPRKPAAAAVAAAQPWPVLQAGPIRVGGVEVGQPTLIAGVALALGFLLGLLARGRRPVAALGLGLILALATTAYALAHEGHDHAEAAAPAPGDGPQRLPDGAVFLPKPSQRLLEIRTAVTRPGTARRAVALIGRVIPDPNRSGLVQSITGGRLLAPEAGLPRLGQSVRQGDVLALVEQALPQADRTTLAEKASEIEQQIALAEIKLRRVRRLAESNVAPQNQVVDAETELEGLRRRREALRQTRVEPEVLRAPVTGTVSAARAVAGQVIAAQDVVFQIVDPASLWVEALAYGEIDPAAITAASAATADGTPLGLQLRGFGRALQQQAALVQFAVETPPATLSVGQPVTVVVQDGAEVGGIILARDAVVRGANGEALVWRHTAPERFEAVPVRVEPLDAARLVVRAGLGAGERVVTRGANLVNQVR